MQRQILLQQWLTHFFPGEKFTLSFAAADADFRRYFRLIFSEGPSFIAMDAPPDKMSIEPYLNVQRIFAAVNVPKIIHYDIDLGFIMMEDMGKVTYLTALQYDSSPAVHRHLMLEAIETLIDLQCSSCVGVLPEYSRELMTKELSLFPDWFCAKDLNQPLTKIQRQLWEQGINILLSVLLSQNQVFVHRDFIVRNLMLTNTRPGVLDFQDAVYGPISYDLVSLLRDAFISWDEEFVLDMVVRYWERAKKQGLPVPVHIDDFWRDCEWMGVQRHLKVVGIFARLWFRDGKEKYRPEIPRFLGYIKKTTRKYKELSLIYRLVSELVGDVEVQSGYTF